MTINSIQNFKAVTFKANTENVKQTSNVQPTTQMQTDKVELSKSNTKTMTTEEKQEIIQEARTTASGWSCLFGLFDTLYYGLRSDKTVAKKFNLDAQQDKPLIKKIKQQQMLATVPAAIVGWPGGLIAWIYNKNSDPSKIDV